MKKNATTVPYLWKMRIASSVSSRETGNSSEMSRRAKYAICEKHAYVSVYGCAYGCWGGGVCVRMCVCVCV